MPSAVLPPLIPLMKALTPIGAGILDHRDEAAGSDVRFLDGAGVPTLSPIVDTRTYFDYHHTAAAGNDGVLPCRDAGGLAKASGVEAYATLSFAYFLQQRARPRFAKPPSCSAAVGFRPAELFV
jgi:hypothetical protein